MWSAAPWPRWGCSSTRCSRGWSAVPTGWTCASARRSALRPALWRALLADRGGRRFAPVPLALGRRARPARRHAGRRRGACPPPARAGWRGASGAGTLVTLPARLGGGTVRAAVAMAASELIAARRAFMADLAPYLGLLALALIVAGWAQLSVGLRPLRDLGARIAALRTGGRSAWATTGPPRNCARWRRKSTTC
jgi:hypothetical protein